MIKLCLQSVQSIKLDIFCVKVRTVIISPGRAKEVNYSLAIEGVITSVCN